MTLSAAILIITVCVNLILGGIVLARNTKNKASQLFFIATLSIVAWTIANYFTNTGVAYNQVVISNHLAYFFAYLVFLFYAWFSFYFPVSRRILGKKSIVLVTLSVLGALFSLTSWVAGGVHLTENETSFSLGVLTVPYALLLLTLVVIIVKNLLSNSSSSEVIVKTQAMLMIFGFSATGILAVISNLLIPVVTNNWGSTKIGPLFTVFLVGSTAYAILKHRLFDIKITIVRSLAYVITIGLVASLYSLLIFGLGDILIVMHISNTGQQLFNVLMAVVVALTFGTLRTTVNRVTNKIFFQDAYDTQEVIRQVSDIVVGTIDNRKVQKGVLNALNKALKSTHMAIVFIHGTKAAHSGYVAGTHWDILDTERLCSVFSAIGKKAIVYDDLGDSLSRLRDSLRDEDISIIVPLVTKEETVGYLILGPKKSGNIYNSQDVGLLNIVSNELAVALQNAQRFEEIQAFNITLQEKVNEATRELKKTNRKLVALDEAKDEFISMASHQLRTPLTSIKGYLSMLAEGDLGKVTKAQEKAIKEAFGSSQRMVYLIADFLNVSRIKTGKFVIEPKEVDLPMVVSEEITQLREMAGSRDITLQYQAPEVFPKVMLDDNKIRQVMMNLVDNAIYYTAAGGTVTIQLFVDSADVVFKVIDTGIGVPKREQHKLFTKFFRAGNARKARPDGTGLGLFMAQKIIAEQGGSIIFESTEGKGSTFGFRFPLSKIKT